MGDTKYSPPKPLSMSPKQENPKAQTLSTSLQMLADEDPDCLLIVRRINKLGFKGARILKRHFSEYGAIVRVLVAHSTVRQHSDMQCQTRRRPSSLGFLQMVSAESVQKILAEGTEHAVEGTVIRVQRFERKQAEAELAPDKTSEDSVFLQTDFSWDRDVSGVSTAASSTQSSCYSSEHSPGETGSDQ